MKYSEIKHEIQALTDSIKKQISDINVEIPGVKPIKGDVLCCVVSFSTISTYNNLDPLFYNAKSQKEQVLKVVSKSKSLGSMINALNKIADNSVLPDGRKLHPVLVNEIDRILEINDCRKKKEV